MSFPIYKMQTLFHKLCMGTTYNFDSAAFTFALHESSSVDLRIVENRHSDIICTYCIASLSGNGQVFCATYTSAT